MQLNHLFSLFLFLKYSLDLIILIVKCRYIRFLVLYYLKVIKYMYFMEATKKVTIIPTNRGLLLVSVVSVGFTLFFFIFVPSLLL